jgi:crossover junction endodeoxyribonuclease RusA
MIYINVIGTPAPQGSKRHVGHGVMVESSEKVAPWREAVANAAVAQVPEASRGLDGPINLRVAFRLKAPASASKKRLALGPVGAPDLSKLVRATEDALTTAGVWKDDSRVVSIDATKRYALPGEATGAVLMIDLAETADLPAQVEYRKRKLTAEEEGRALEADLEQRRRGGE